MTATQPIQPIAVDFGGMRRREFRRLLIASAVAHVVGMFALSYTPTSKTMVPKGILAVELVSLPAPSAPPAAAPSPKPAEPVAKPIPPPPARPKPKKIVLPAEPTTPKPKVVAKAPPKVTRPAPPKPKPEQDYDDVLASLRAQSGESRPSPVVRDSPAAVGRAVGPVGSPDGVAVSPQVAAWLKRAKIHVQKNWVVPPGFRTQALEAQVEVDLDAGGTVRGTPRLTKRSGNPWYDEGVVRAIQKSSPLPVPPEAGKWPFVFVPEDSY